MKALVKVRALVTKVIVVELDDMTVTMKAAAAQLVEEVGAD